MTISASLSNMSFVENFVEPAIETSLTPPSSCSHPFFKSPIPFGTGWFNRISAETRTGQGYCSIQPVQVFLLRLLAAHGHFWQTGIEISYIPRNLIIVIFYYQISLNPLKTLSLSQVSFPLLFPLCYIVPPVFTNSNKGKNKGKKII